jgi:hypothetical protein
MAKKMKRRNHRDRVESIQKGDLISIEWDDVTLDDKCCLGEIKPPFNFDPTTNIGWVVYRGKRLRNDWLLITSEAPADLHSPGAVVTAFPSGVLSTARIRVVERYKKKKE